MLDFVFDLLAELLPRKVRWAIYAVALTMLAAAIVLALAR